MKHPLRGGGGGVSKNKTSGQKASWGIARGGRIEGSCPIPLGFRVWGLDRVQDLGPPQAEEADVFGASAEMLHSRAGTSANSNGWVSWVTWRFMVLFDQQKLHLYCALTWLKFDYKYRYSWVKYHGPPSRPLYSDSLKPLCALNVRGHFHEPLVAIAELYWGA